ncbi:MAG: phytanoyl-CoA dioxygenase family protein [Pseudomonadota bacterium]
MTDLPAAVVLARDGLAVLPRAIDPAAIVALAADLDPVFAATPFCEGDFYGARTKRFGGLLNRSSLGEQLVMHPQVLGIAEEVLGAWCDRIALNLTQGIEIHPGALRQYPHRDQDMWGGPKGGMEYLVNVIWPLTPFTAANGATRLWPGSHKRQDLTHFPENEAIAIEMEPGDALLFLGSTLHGGGGNMTDGARRGIIVSYCLGWLKPFELQWLVYPPVIARAFNPELAALVGYAQHRPNLGNVEGQCPSRLLEHGLAESRAAVDALRPDQTEALSAYIAGQLGEME